MLFLPIKAMVLNFLIVSYSSMKIGCGNIGGRNDGNVVALAATCAGPRWLDESGQGEEEEEDAVMTVAEMSSRSGAGGEEQCNQEGGGGRQEALLLLRRTTTTMGGIFLCHNVGQRTTTDV